MKIDTQIKQNVDNNDAQIQLSCDDNELLSAVNVPFTELLADQLNGYAADNSQNMLSSLDIDFNYDSVSMNLEDALFFVNMAQEGQFSVSGNQNGNFSELIQTEITQNVVSQRSVEVTNQLTNLIEKSMNTQKPVRISFDNDVSVVLKVDKEGKVSAEFIPGNSEVESYLRNNIASLKQKFDEQNLPYNDLFYRQNSRQNGKQSRDKNKGEQQ